MTKCELVAAPTGGRPSLQLPGMPAIGPSQMVLIIVASTA